MIWIMTGCAMPRRLPAASVAALASAFTTCGGAPLRTAACAAAVPACRAAAAFAEDAAGPMHTTEPTENGPWPVTVIGPMRPPEVERTDFPPGVTVNV